MHFTPRQFNLLVFIYHMSLAICAGGGFPFLLLFFVLAPFLAKSECKPTRKAVLTLASLAIIVLLAVVSILVRYWLRYLWDYR